MDEREIRKNALAFAERNLSIYTGFIHYKNIREKTRDVIPLVENILYGMTLVASLSKEKAEKGLKQLERLFAFFTTDGFVGYIHDFPRVYSDRPNVEIVLALSFFLKNYGKLIPSSSRSVIKSVLEKLISIVEKRELKPYDRLVFDTAVSRKSEKMPPVTTFEEYERTLLCSLLKEEKIELSWHEPLGVYAGPLEGVYYDGHSPCYSLVQQVVLGKEESSSSLYGALLKNGTCDAQITFESFPRYDILINHQKEEVSIHFAHHSLVAKGAMDVKLEENHIDFFLEEFEEVEFYFSNHSKSKVTVDGEKATAFYQQDKIVVEAEGASFTLSFHGTKNRFMGHIMLGNRPNQLVDCNKNFTLFDHKILLKKTF